MSRSRKIAAIAALVTIVVLILLLLSFCQRQPAVRALTPHPLTGTSTLSLGDAVVSGFTDIVVVAPSKPTAHAKPAIDRAFINVDGPAVRIFDPRRPRTVWDGHYWAAPRRHDVTAREIGQVFGITIDSAAYPNVYFAATSVYGLNLVRPDSDDDGLPERIRKGSSGASWMAGQFGPGGAPGSIWKLDGSTGELNLFATIKGVGPASLGNVSFDPVHNQLFVSDLDSGLIHRFNMAGRDLGTYDHGTTGRASANLGTIADDGNHASITNAAFDSEDPATWGATAAGRRVWGLAVHGTATDGARLFYGVADGTIWSVGLDKDGDFTSSSRLEITLPGGAKESPISDIVFTHDGRMTVAQRAIIGTKYDYSPLPPSGLAHVYRYWPENPDNLATATRWYHQPEEYGVGFAGDSRNSAGGIALGYGYHNITLPEGTIETVIDWDGCEDAMFFTGDMLRDFHAVDNGFAPVGPLHLYGLQLSPSGPVRGFNVPPGISYFVNYATTMGSTDRRGMIGDVAVYRVDCKDSACATQGSTTFSTEPVSPERHPATTTTTTGGHEGQNDDGCTGAECEHTERTCRPGDPGCDEVCPPDDPTCRPREACLKADGEVVCDPQLGWIAKVMVSGPSVLGIDTIRAYSKPPPNPTTVTVGNGPEIPVAPPAVIQLIGAIGGETVTLDVCGYNTAAAATGQPYDCCRATVRVRVPKGTCVPAQEESARQ